MLAVRRMKFSGLFYLIFSYRAWCMFLAPPGGEYKGYIDTQMDPELQGSLLDGDRTAFTILQEARSEIFPAMFSDTLASRLDIIKQLTWKNNPDDPQQGVRFFYTQEKGFEGLPILALDYDVVSYGPGGRRLPAFNGFSILVNDQDFSGPGARGYNEKIVFYIRGDPRLGYTRRLKLEFKNARGQRGVYIIDGITSEWQRIEIDKRDVGGDFAFKGDWKDIKEIVLVFEDHRVTRGEGRIYLAGFTYPESWQVAETAKKFYQKVQELTPEERNALLGELVGPGVIPDFRFDRVEDIWSWIISSHENIIKDTGVSSLYEVLKESSDFPPSYSDIRVASVLASIVSQKSSLDFDYRPSLYSLYRAARVTGNEIYGVKLENFNQLEDLFNKIGQKPILIEFKTGEYLKLNGFERGGFLWLTKFAKLETAGEDIRMSEDEFNRLWTGYILTPEISDPYKPLTNEEIFAWQNENLILEDLIQEAKDLARRPYQPVQIRPIPVLDPPVDGRPESQGLVYQEYLAIKGDKFLDDGKWWAEARPRGSQNRYPLRIFMYDQNNRQYREVKYELDKYDYSSPIIQPPIEEVPEEGRYITALDLGHILVAGKFPQFFTIGGDGYMRFVPLAEGREMGASFRVAGHNVTWSKSRGSPRDEDFPIVRKIYLKKISETEMGLLALIDSEGFTGVMDMKIKPGDETRMLVNARFFPRRDILVREEPNTGFAAFSSMFFLGERHTPWRDDDEAHDSDYLVVRYDDGKVFEKALDRPVRPDVYVFDYGRVDARVRSFSLQQRDRNPAHYRAFPTSDYTSRPSFDLDLIYSSIPLKVKLYEIYTDNEYIDNIVVLLAIDQDLRQGQEISLKYEVRSYDYQE